MTTPDRRLESITPEDELHFKLLHELSEGKRNDRHLQVLFDLNKRFESVKSVAKEIVELSKEWGKIHKEKDALSDPDLTKAINEYARKVVSLEDDLLELEASEIEVEKKWWKKQQAEIKKLTANHDAHDTQEQKDVRTALLNAFKEASKLFAENTKNTTNVEKLRQYGRLKRQVVELVQELGGKIDEAIEESQEEKKQATAATKAGAKIDLAASMVDLHARQAKRGQGLASEFDTTDSETNARTARKAAQTPPPVPKDAKPLRKKGVPPPPPAEAFITPAERRAARQRDTLTDLKAVKLDAEPEISPDEAWAAERREDFEKPDFRLFTNEAIGLVARADNSLVIKMNKGEVYKKSLVLAGIEPKYGAKMASHETDKTADFVVLDYGSLHVVIKPTSEGDTLLVRVDHVETMRSVPQAITNAEDLKAVFLLATELLKKSREEQMAFFAPDAKSVRDTLVDQPAVVPQGQRGEEFQVPGERKGWWGKLKDVFSNKEVQKKGAKALFYDTPARILGVKALTDLVGAIPQLIGRGGEGFGDLAQFLKNKKEVAAELDTLNYSVGEVVLELAELIKDKRLGDSAAEREVVTKLARLDALIADIKNISAAERQTLKQDLVQIIARYGEAKKEAEAELHKRTREILQTHVRNQISKLSLVRDWMNLAMTGAGLPVARAVVYGGIGLSELFLRTKREQKEGAALTTIAATAAKESFRALMFKGRKEGASALTRGVEGFAAIGQALSVFGIGMAVFGGEHPNGSEGVQAILKEIQERGYKAGGEKVWNNFIDRSELLLEKIHRPTEETAFASAGDYQASRERHALQSEQSQAETTELTSELTNEQIFVKHLLTYPTLLRNREALRDVIGAAEARNHHGDAGRIVGEVKLLTFKALVEHGASEQELATFVREQNFTLHELEHLKGVHLAELRSGKTLDSTKIAEALRNGLGKKGGTEGVFAAKGSDEYRHALHELHGNRLRLQGPIRLYGFDSATGKPILGGEGRAQVLTEVVVQRANTIAEGQMLRIVGKSGMELGRIQYHAGVSDEALREWKQMGAHIYPVGKSEVQLGTHPADLHGSDIVRRYVTTPDGKREFLVGTVDMQPTRLPTGDTLATAKGEMLSTERSERVVRTFYSGQARGREAITARSLPAAETARSQSKGLSTLAEAGLTPDKIRPQITALHRFLSERIRHTDTVVGLKDIDPEKIQAKLLAWESRQLTSIDAGKPTRDGAVFVEALKAMATGKTAAGMAMIRERLTPEALGLSGMSQKALDLMLADRPRSNSPFLTNGSEAVRVEVDGSDVLVFIPGVEHSSVDAEGNLVLDYTNGNQVTVGPGRAAELVSTVRQGIGKAKRA